MQISVIVPVRNEESSISVLLDGLLAQSLIPQEIVIADGGSTDATTSIISEYVDRGAPIQLIRSGPAMPGRGRNLAASRAVGEWLAFIDAGVCPDKRWLENLARRVTDDSEVVVYGSYEPVIDTLFKECAALAYLQPPREVEGAFIRPRSITSALMKRSIWEAVGGFPEDLRSAEDLLFMNKVERAGYRVARAPDAVVHWYLQPDIWQTFKRFVTYARNNIRAGLWRQWQAAIFQRYAVLAASALPAHVFGYSWLLVTLILWFLTLAARGLVSLRRNRRCYPANPRRNFVRLLVLIPLIAVLDAATFVGSIQWLLKDKLRLACETVRGGNAA